LFRSAAFFYQYPRARGNSVRDNPKQEELIAQKQIDALTATVRKVSERVELRAPVPQIAANDD